MQTNTVIELLEQLIACPSVTPKDANCQQLIAEFLQPLGFKIQSWLDVDTQNFFATRIVNPQAPLFCFAGHTDVVPASPETWDSPPFQLTQRDGKLYGRGVADMKGAIAAMCCAMADYLGDQPDNNLNLAIMLTSDEEGDATHGTHKILKRLQEQGIQLDYVLVGEPTSETQLGDAIKIGRRGSLHGHLEIMGKEGHLAYPELNINAIHLAAPVIQALSQLYWGDGNAHFSDTSLQISNIHAGQGVSNISPGRCSLDFNLRFSPQLTLTEIQSTVENLVARHLKAEQFNLDWRCTAKPFICPPGKLFKACQTSIQNTLGITAQASTAGGTSDARFIAPHCSELIEFGLCNQSIHQPNESIEAKSLVELSAIYKHMLKTLGLG